MDSPIALGFLKFGINDLVDILLIAILLYWLYRLLRGTGAVKIFWGVFIIFIVWNIASYYHLTMFSGLLGQIFSVGLIALIIIYQPEIRKFLAYIGNTRLTRFFKVHRKKKLSAEDYSEDIDSIVRACKRMSNSQTGALIILARATPLYDYLETGERIDSLISRELLENIFFKNSPLHDGAVIINNHRIAAARCILPVSHEENLPTDLGLRHRSAIGATQLTDALAIVVSEQTGQISLCKQGVITRDISPTVLNQMLKKELQQM